MKRNMYAVYITLIQTVGPGWPVNSENLCIIGGHFTNMVGCGTIQGRFDLKVEPFDPVQLSMIPIGYGRAQFEGGDVIPFFVAISAPKYV